MRKEDVRLTVDLKTFSIKVKTVKTFARGGKRQVVGGAGHVEGKPLDHSPRNEGILLSWVYITFYSVIYIIA